MQNLTNYIFLFQTHFLPLYVSFLSSARKFILKHKTWYTFEENCILRNDAGNSYNTSSDGM